MNKKNKSLFRSYNPTFDDRKKLKHIYYSEPKTDEKSNIKKRFANMIIEEKKFLTAEIETEETLYLTDGGRQKITAILYDINGENRMSSLYISRINNSNNKLYGNGAKQISLSCDSIKVLYNFLSKVCSLKSQQIEGKIDVPLDDNKRLSSNSLQVINKNQNNTFPPKQHSKEDLYEYLKQFNKDELLDLLAEKENLTLENFISFGLNKKKFNPSDLQLIVELKNKENAIKEFKSRLNNEKLNEDKGDDNWQNWFCENKWFFGSDYVKILTRRTLDENSKTDFLASSYGNFLDIIEIKSPSLDDGRLFNEDIKEKEGAKWKYYHPTNHLTKAIFQCLRYINEVEKKVADPEKNKKFETCEIVKPRCTLIFGRSNNFNNDQHKTLRIMNSHYNNFSIITYDQLLERAEKMIKIINNKKEEAQ